MSTNIRTFLWFDGVAREAAEFYVGVFPNSRIGRTAYTTESHGTVGEVLIVEFELDGKPFVAMNGGPQHPHTPAISLQIDCHTQEEIDRYWDALLAGGGTEVACGWLADRYGVSWQVTPVQLIDLITGDDAAAAERATAAMMQMVKLDLAALEAAAAGA